MSHINAELKDKILNLLIDNNIDCTVGFDIQEAAALVGTGFQTFDNIISYFENLGLITCSRCLGGTVEVTILPTAFDIKNKGGFRGIEIIENANIELLFKQLQEIKTTDNSKKIELIIGTLQTIFAGISAFK